KRGNSVALGYLFRGREDSERLAQLPVVELGECIGLEVTLGAREQGIDVFGQGNFKGRSNTAMPEPFSIRAEPLGNRQEGHGAVAHFKWVQQRAHARRSSPDDRTTPVILKSG